MPIYCFECQKCLKYFEEFGKVTDKEPANCSDCNIPAKKVIPLPGRGVVPKSIREELPEIRREAAEIKARIRAGDVELRKNIYGK